MDASKCLVFERRVPLRLEEVDCRRRGQVQTRILVSMYSCLVEIIFVDLPAGTTPYCDEYDTYARVVVEPFNSDAAVLGLYFAIDSDGLDGFIWITTKRSLYHIETGCPV